MPERLTSFDQIQPPIKVAFFDLGGVVFSFNGLKTLAQMVHKPPAEIRDYWISRDNDLCRGVLAPQQFYMDLVSHFGMGDPDLDFLHTWTSEFEAISETRLAMEAVRLRGVSLGIVSNIYPGFFDFAVTMGAVPAYDYAVVVQSCELGIVKPDPEIFNHALRLARVLPEEAVLIDDRAENIEAVERLGWYSLPFPPSRN